MKNQIYIYIYIYIFDVLERKNINKAETNRMNNDDIVGMLDII